MSQTFTLNNGVCIPSVGFGTYKAEGSAVAEPLKQAVQSGYRHIDTAAVYHNEKELGQAIQECGVDREQLFITSKVWNTERGYEKTKAAFEKTLSDLRLDYLDLYLIHWPANRKQFGEQADEINAQTWRALEELYESGKVKAIGVSNFFKPHIVQLMKTAKIVPMVDQIEFHPGWTQSETVDFCQENGIVVEAWSPLGRGAMLENETLQKLAASYQKTVAQVCIRWALQRKIVPLPKSTTPSRIKENFDVFDFCISEQDMKAINMIQDPGGHHQLPDEVDF